MLIKRKKGLVFQKSEFDKDRNSLSNYLAKQIVLCRLIHTYIRITKSTTYKQTVTAFHEEIELVTGTYNVRNSQLTAEGATSAQNSKWDSEKLCATSNIDLKLDAVTS